MKLLTSTYEEQRADISPMAEWRKIRCAPVAEHLSLAVIKMDRPCDTLAPALAACLRGVTGVIQVQIDSPRRTVQLLYDGQVGTVRNVHRLLIAMGWANEENAEANGYTHV